MTGSVSISGSISNRGGGDSSTNIVYGEQSMQRNSVGNFNAAFGNGALNQNTSGSYLLAVGANALSNNTTGNNNTAFGFNAGTNVGSGSSNNIIGVNQDTYGYGGCSMIGVSDTATANNQMRFGSNSVNNGVVTTEAVVSDRTWSVFINGTAYKILLKA